MATSDLFPLVHRIDSNGIALNVLELAPENKATATLVMHHGLRDSAYALLPIASVLSEQFHVLLPELRLGNLKECQCHLSGKWGNTSKVY